MFDPSGNIDMLDDPFRQQLPEDSRLKVAVSRAAGDRLIGFHEPQLSSSPTPPQPPTALAAFRRSAATRFRQHARRDAMTSPMESLDDTGVAFYLRQATEAQNVTGVPGKSGKVREIPGNPGDAGKVLLQSRLHSSSTGRDRPMKSTAQLFVLPPKYANRMAVSIREAVEDRLYPGGRSSLYTEIQRGEI